MKPLLLFVCAILSFVIASAQKKPPTKVNIDVKNGDINSIATQLEKQADIKFFFDPEDFNAIRFSIAGQQLTLTQILDKIFTGTDYHYTFFKSNVILTKGKR